MKNKSVLSAVIRLLVCFTLGSTVWAQLSFLQFPTYSGSGNAFSADFNGDGKLDVLTSDGTMNLGKGDGTFTLGTPVSGTPLAVADFNGDGKPDILEQGTGTLLVLLGNGDGSFQTAVVTLSGASLTKLAAADLNGDGKADLVGVFGAALMVYISNGDGTFASGASYSMGVANPGSTVLSLGDFNGDGKTDVAVSVAGNNVAGEEIVFLGNGNGTLQITPKASNGILYPAYGVTGDFNGDGKLDLVLSGDNITCSPSCKVYVLIGKGDGTFDAPAAAFPGGGELAAADLNGDGKLDLVFEEDPTVGQIYLGKGDGTFSDAHNYVRLPNLYAYVTLSTIAIGDFNLDGNRDIALSNTVLLGDGSGSFQGVQLGVVPGPFGAIVVGSFNKSAAPGVAMLSNQEIGNSYFYNVNVLENDGGGGLALGHTYALQKPGYAIVTADFNGDGNLDLVVFETDPISQDWSYSVLLGNGDGSFQSAVYYPQGVVGIASATVVVADFNNDHKLDLAVGGVGTQSLAVLLGNGDGTFAAPVYYYDQNGTNLLAGDYNLDGKVDIAVGVYGATGSSYQTAILYGKGDGTFQAAVFPPSLNNFSPLFVADLNNDGKPDLVSRNQVAVGNGDGTFTLLPALSAFVFGIADLNGDGKQDIFVEISSSTGRPLQTGVQLGNGDGSFGPLINVPETGYLQPAAFADMNGDGSTDIVFVWDSHSSIQTPVNGAAVLLNTTQPGFELTAGTLSPAPVTAGNSATATITVVPMFGFNTTVTLSCLGLPSGASCAFTPATIPNSSGTSTATITTVTNTPAGTYPVQVQGSAGSVVNSAVLSLVVQAPPDFGLSMASGTPASQTANPGQVAKFSLLAAATGSMSGTLNLTCSITPVVTPAPTCALSSSSLQLGGSASQPFTVTVTTIGPMTTAALPYSGFPSGSFLVLCASMLFGSGWIMLSSRKRFPSFAVLLVALLSWVGCGGSSSSHTTPGTPAGTYTATVAGTLGSVTHNIPLQVVVQ